MAIVLQDAMRNDAEGLTNIKGKQVASPVELRHKDRLELLEGLVPILLDRPDLAYCAVQLLDYIIDKLSLTPAAMEVRSRSPCVTWYELLAQLALTQRLGISKSPLSTRLHYHALSFKDDCTSAAIPTSINHVQTLCSFVLLYAVIQRNDTHAASADQRHLRTRLAAVASRVGPILHDVGAVEAIELKETTLVILKSAYQRCQAATEGDNPSRKRGADSQHELLPASMDVRFQHALQQLNIPRDSNGDRWTAQLSQILDDAESPSEFRRRAAIICSLSVPFPPSETALECEICTACGTLDKATHTGRYLKDDAHVLIKPLLNTLATADAPQWRMAYSQALRAAFNHTNWDYADRFDAAQLLAGLSAKSRNTRLLYGYASQPKFHRR